jgi:hypothetical protein
LNCRAADAKKSGYTSRAVDALIAQAAKSFGRSVTPPSRRRLSVSAPATISTAPATVSTAVTTTIASANAATIASVVGDAPFSGPPDEDESYKAQNYDANG